MSLARLALCLTLLASSQGFAQAPEEWTPYTPPATQGEPPPPLVPAPPPPPPVGPAAPAPAQPPAQAELIPRSAAPEDQTGLRLVVTPWAGAVAGMMGLIIGVVPSAILALPFCLTNRNFDEPGCAIAFTTGMALSYSLGVTLGVGFVGSRLGGRGDWMATFLGAAAGAALGGGIGLSTHNTGVLLLGLSLAPLVGAVVGYEASHNLALDREAAAQHASTGFQVVPVVGATGRGGILGGLAGRF